ncbi:AraC family transcriptional regulator [Paenibacillus alba]|uniref:AraC family transcriptional regulator n=1 Tax=Paenibacillus alba TaxID=1197127 RepID=UPI0015644C31|nr:AraC family transcriptional regulator [Paenibacillus alba]NQX70296.1 AraC family transcriptional regulator [Paenibacillus alba]
MDERIIRKTGYDMLDHIWIKLRTLTCIEDKGWRLTLDFVQSHTLMIAISSKLKVVVDGRICFLKPGNAYICLPGQLVEASAAEEHEGGLFLFQFDAVVEAGSTEGGLELSRQKSVFPISGEISLADRSSISSLCSTISGNMQSASALDRMRGQAAFQDLLCRLLQDALPAAVQDQDSEALMDRTRTYMEQHFAQNITIDELAEMAGVSRYYYMRTFKLQNGRSAMDYLSELRINQAKVLMEKTKIRLRDIAKQVGYNDEYYFIRKFKQQVGIPPATYIKNRQRKVAAYSFPNIGQLLALKIVPFAAPMDHSWTDLYRRKYQYDVVTKLSHDYEFNREALRTARPDYIIGIDHFVPIDEQEKLKQVAPAFFVPWLKHNWREHLRLTSEFLGISSAAEQWIEDYERKAKIIRDQVKGVVNSDTVMIVQITEADFYVYGERSIADVLYSDLQLNCPQQVKGIDTYQPATLQQLGDYDADRILLMFTNERSLQENWEILQRNEAWRALKAVQNHGVALISPWMWFEYSAYTQERFLSEALAVFKA